MFISRSILGLFVLAGVAGCAAKSAGNPVSTVGGQLDASSFPTAPTGVDAVDEGGARVHAPLAADGTFQLRLTKGHHYRLVVVRDAIEEPLVFPRASGRLDTGFRVSTGAAHVALGAVHNVAALAPGSAQGTMAVALPSGTPNGVGGSDNVSCDDGNDQNANDGECVNGKDTLSQKACIDDSVEVDADPSQEMALPEHSVPDDVGGCADGTDEEGGGEGETNGGEGETN